MESCIRIGIVYTKIGIVWKVTVLLQSIWVGGYYKCSSQKSTSKWCIIDIKRPLLLQC